MRARKRFRPLLPTLPRGRLARRSRPDRIDEIVEALEVIERCETECEKSAAACMASWDGPSTLDAIRACYACAKACAEVESCLLRPVDDSHYRLPGLLRATISAGEACANVCELYEREVLVSCASRCRECARACRALERLAPQC